MYAMTAEIFELKKNPIEVKFFKWSVLALKICLTEHNLYK